MDENEIMDQGTQEETDSFMDGWEETSPPGEERPEETGETGDSGDQAVPGFEEPGQAGSESTEGAGNPEGTGEAGGSADQTVPGAEDLGQAVQQQAPRTWTLNHLGQTVTANEADMVTLAQKGLDYDRIRGEYDEARPVMDLFRDYAKRAGVTVPEYLARIRAQAKQAEGMSQEEARRAVDLEDREAVVAQQEAERQQAQEAQRQELARRQAVDDRMRADLKEFRDVFPEAAKDPASIPQEVWADVRNGRTLVAAYAAYSQRTRQEHAAREEARRAQQARNEAASTGSMRSQDGGKGPKDPFLDGFESD